MTAANADPLSQQRNSFNAMPYVNVQITKGASRDQKAELVRDVTDSLVRVLGKRPEHIHVVIQEIGEADWGYAGQLTDDYRRRSAGGSSG